MKKVFSGEKLIKYAENLGLKEHPFVKESLRTWVPKCEGLTQEEMKMMRIYC